MKMTVKNGPANAQLGKLIDGLHDNKLRVGWFPSAVYPNGMPVANIAAIQEFGSSNGAIPSRSFMRTTMVEQESAWRTFITNRGKKIAAGSMTTEQLADQFGLRVAGDIAKKISKITSPALSPVTLQLRYWKNAGVKITGKKMVGQAARLVGQGINNTLSGSAAKPLVDSRMMMESVTHTVTKS